ncbi:hypothetical protein ACO0LL_21810 [Undibacterium sp. TC4M20W]|uniref:hypothetical protein n=1 Tax=unclassified Undibacterium TaxID=2630295 RepID=UPI003BF435DA
MSSEENFDVVFQRVISLWPASINVSNKKFHDNGGVTIPELSKVHDMVEAAIYAIEDNEYLLKMDWAIFTVLHGSAKSQDQIVPANIDLEKLHEVFDRYLAPMA